jgi:uncharacterized protein
VHLKSLVDTYPHIRFVASSSAAAALRMKSRESGAGRSTEFFLPPLTFAEYLRFANQEQALIREAEPSEERVPTYLANDIHGLNTEFIHYLNYGGFPEAVMNPQVRANPARFLRQDIVDKVLLKDLPSLYGIGDTQELNSFFNVLAFNAACAYVQGVPHQPVHPRCLVRHGRGRRWRDGQPGRNGGLEPMAA